jgi:DNA-binding transcriptional MocR family regulator
MARIATPDEIYQVVARAQDRGVAVHPLGWFAFDREPQAGLLLGYGAITAEQIPEGLNRLLASLES